MKFEELETPCFIINKTELENNIKSFKKALDENFPNNIFSYSVKTNSLPYILNTVKIMGGFAEVVSSDEYNLAKEIGFIPSKIIYNGPMKNKETFIDAVKNGAYVNIETKREIEWLKEIEVTNIDNINIGIRININLGI